MRVASAPPAICTFSGGFRCASSEGVHALQIEIARGLYMDEVHFVRRAGFERLQGHLTHLAGRVAEAAPRLLG